MRRSIFLIALLVLLPAVSLAASCTQTITSYASIPVAQNVTINYTIYGGGGGGMTGYGWGSTNIGWVDFEYARSAFQCTPQYTCNGNIIQNSCDASQNVTCTSPAFCSPGSAACLYPSPAAQPSGNLTGHLQLKPSLLPKNATTKVYWNIANVNSCTVTSTNGDSFSGATGAGLVSKPITQQTIFTLTCTALDNSTYTESATATTLPVYQER